MLKLNTLRFILWREYFGIIFIKYSNITLYHYVHSFWYYFGDTHCATYLFYVLELNSKEWKRKFTMNQIVKALDFGCLNE